MREMIWASFSTIRARIVRKNTGVDLSLHVHEMNRARRSWYSGGIHVLRAKHE